MVWEYFGWLVCLLACLCFVVVICGVFLLGCFFVGWFGCFVGGVLMGGFVCGILFVLVFFVCGSVWFFYLLFQSILLVK